MKYPVRTEFFASTNTENAYGEVIKAQTPTFETGCRSAMVSFKDAMQSNLSVDGERQYLYARKNPNTLAVKLGDEVRMPNVSGKTYSVIGIDPKLTDRAELMFLIDAKET